MTDSRLYPMRLNDDRWLYCPRTDLHGDDRLLFLKFNGAEYSKWECVACGYDFIISIRQVPDRVPR